MTSSSSPARSANDSGTERERGPERPPPQHHQTPQQGLSQQHAFNTQQGLTAAHQAFNARQHASQQQQIFSQQTIVPPAPRACYPPTHGRSDSASSDNAPQKVPIPRESRPESRRDSTPAIGAACRSASIGDSMTTQPTGPMTNPVQLPNRPRPGRKPIPQENAGDRRRFQNRMAQRNFRDKRQQKLFDTQDMLAALRKEFQEESSELTRKLQEHVDMVAELRSTNAAVIKRAEEAERRVAELEAHVRGEQFPSSTGAFRPFAPGVPHVVQTQEATPPVDDQDELDFTNYGRSPRLHPAPNRNDGNGMNYMIDATDHCGFCKDAQNCICAQEAAAPAPVEDPPRPKKSRRDPQQNTLAGNCDQCRADPARAKACRDMAIFTRVAAPPSSVAPTDLSSASMGPPLSHPGMSCSAMVDHFARYGERSIVIGDLFGGRLTAYPGPTSGYALDEREAAEVLSSLKARSEASRKRF